MINRRRFIETGSLASLGSILSNISCNQSKSELKKELGVQIHSVRPQLVMDFEGTLSKISKIGYKNIEAYGLNSEGLFIEKISPKYYKETVENFGMNLLSSHINYFNFEDINRIIDSALEAEIKYGIIPITPEKYRQSINGYKEFAEYLNKVGEKFNESGIIFGFHNHDFQFNRLENEIPYEILLQYTMPNIVTFQMDLYWATKGGADPIYLINKYPGRFKSFHVKDLDELYNRASVGSGIIDFESIFNLKQVAGLMDYFVEDFRPNHEPYKKLEKSFNYLNNSDFAN
tara:strand:- start:9948 stop:10811 length:864 start_codon:yes stop_codon:yes gene_type:complete